MPCTAFLVKIAAQNVVHILMYLYLAMYLFTRTTSHLGNRSTYRLSMTQHDRHRFLHHGVDAGFPRRRQTIPAVLSLARFMLGFAAYGQRLRCLLRLKWLSRLIPMDAASPSSVSDLAVQARRQMRFMLAAIA